MLSMVTVWAAEGGHESASPWIPYAVGGGTLALLLLLLAGLVAFGAGREHS
jgi:hypothetical protein